MSSALDQLLTLLKLKKSGEQQFIGQSENLGLPQVYGGQVIGQALSAAKKTVAIDRYVHSFHSYFLRRGNPLLPITYDVENLRDGKSFSTRRVKAVQQDQPIFYLTASYHQEEIGLEHQIEMPEIQGPEHFYSETQLIQQIADKLPPAITQMLDRERPIEVRPVVINHPLSPQKLPPDQALWIKANGQLGDDLRIHQYLLAYASDWGFLTTALQPHGLTLFTPKLKIASIDHAMWYHRQFRMDEWLLFVIKSPTTAGARGFVRGEFFDQKGRLIASVTQEGMIRTIPNTIEDTGRR